MRVVEAKRGRDVVSEEREDLMLRAAQMYYYEGLTQAAIAERLGSTRWTVGRLLEEARSSGMVTVTISHPRARDRSLEESLRSTFGVSEAIVVPTQESAAATLSVVAAAAAEFIAGLRPRPGTMAVSWGRTLAAVARAMPNRWTRGLVVYQTFGGLVRSVDDVVSDSIGLMARKGQGVGYTIPAPAIVGDPNLGHRLRHEPSIASTLRAAAGADVTVFSPGTLRDDSILVRSGYLGGEDIESLRSRGAVADVFSHYVDSHGQPVSKEMDDRSVAMSLDALRKANLPVVVGAGVEKVEAMKVSVNSGLARVIVTDSGTASEMMAGL